MVTTLGISEASVSGGIRAGSMLQLLNLDELAYSRAGKSRGTAVPWTGRLSFTDIVQSGDGGGSSLETSPVRNFEPLNS